MTNDQPVPTRAPLPLPALPEEPLVSVLTASYNYDRYVGRALDSLLAQSYPHFEALVCDDGSTDASCETVARYAQRDARIRLLRKENGGVASALNAAFRASRGDVICLLDADDFFEPEKLEQVVHFFQSRPDVGFAMHALRVVDEQGSATGRIPFLGAFEEGWIAEAVHARGGRWRALPAGALCFRSTLADLLFPIPEALFRSEADGYLFTLAPLLATVGFLPAVLAGYRLHGANLTGTTRLDRTVATRRLDALHRKNEAVNQRLRELDPDAERLDLRDNLNYWEQTFALALFEGRPRRALLRAYRPLARLLLGDDLYRPLRKALGLIAYGSAIMLPAPVRPAWLTMILGARTARRSLQRIVDRGAKGQGFNG